MKYLLDTNVCIRYLNGQSEGIRQRLGDRNPERIVLCSIVKAELLYGVHKSRNVARNLRKLAQFVDRFISLPFDDTAAEIYGRIRTRLEQAGAPIGPNDLMIAAIAVANDVVLVTHNTREFSRVEELEFEDWEN